MQGNRKHQEEPPLPFVCRLKPQKRPDLSPSQKRSLREIEIAAIDFREQLEQLVEAHPPANSFPLPKQEETLEERWTISFVAQQTKRQNSPLSGKLDLVISYTLQSVLKALGMKAERIQVKSNQGT
jgi:hypothetical protein